MSSSCGKRAGGPSTKRARRTDDGDDEAAALFGHGRFRPADGAMVNVDGFGDDTLVWARVEQPGVWRELGVLYSEWSVNSKERHAVFNDKRCGHVHKLRLSDINADIANSLTRLTNLEELTIEPFSICDASDHFAPPPGIWPQLRRLYIGYGGIIHAGNIVSDQKVLSLVAAAPNVRELCIWWTRRLHCLPAILVGLPMLETLRLHYVNVDENGTRGHANLLDCKQLDIVTPPMLLSMCLDQDEYAKDNGKEAAPATMELAAALVRMQGRSPQRFAIELCGKHF